MNNLQSLIDRDLRGQTYNDGSVVPFFLYLIVTNGEGKLVSLSSSDSHKESDGEYVTRTELDSNNSQGSISDVIKQHISEGLQQLYNSSSSSSVASSEEENNQVVSITPIVEQIIKYYNDNIDKLPTAVTDINKSYAIQLKTNNDEEVDVSTMSSTSFISQQPTPKKIATNNDGNTIDSLRELLKLPKNNELLKDSAYIEPTAGGSRSRKNSRRHKQKKNKNTKRRSRK